MKLTIDRRHWLRGEGSTHSRLLRPADNKMCCVGFYAIVLGATKEQIADRSTIAQTPVCPDWASGFGSENIMDLYEANDDTDTDDKFKEQKIKKLFAKHDVKVKFVN